VAEDKQPKKRPSVKKTETLRQRTDRVASDAQKPKARRIKRTASTISQPFRKIHRIGKKEYHPIRLPKNRFGRILGLRVRLFPRFFINAWRELRQVEWPNMPTTMRLVFAVFIFAIVFGTIITVVDFGLDKVFKHVFLK
jgi:preprotein translocase SecE subunit